MASVTILLATYNNEAHVAELLDSLLAQDFGDFRLDIRDDSSVDQTPGLLSVYEKRDARIHVDYGKQPSGSAQNNFFRLLLACPDSDYILFCDADDVWLPDKVRVTLARMQQAEAQYGRQTPLLVHGDLAVVDAALQPIAPSLFRYEGLSPARSSLRNLLCQNNVTGCTVMINRALRALVPQQPAHSVMHDWWLALIAAAFGHIEVIDRPLLLYRQHGDNSVGAYNAHDPLLAVRKLSRRDKVRAVYAAMFAQAGCFAETFREQLTPEQYRLCTEYAALADKGKFGRIASILRNGFYKNTLQRNIGQFIAM